MSTSKRPDKAAKTRQMSRNGSIGQLGKQPQQASTRLSRSLAMQDLKRLALGTRTPSHAMNFGKPSSVVSANTPKSTGGVWNGLVQKTITDGASQMLGGGLLGSGISSTFSALLHLFGRGTQTHTPPLERFSLPAVEQRTIDVAQNLLTNLPNVGAYQTTAQTSTQGKNVSSAVEQAAVVRAVRNALLTSSSLNDIIGEL